MKQERLSVDVAIVGAGPAGLSAARAAARSGRRLRSSTTTRVRAGRSGGKARRRCRRRPPPSGSPCCGSRTSRISWRRASSPKRSRRAAARRRRTRAAARFPHADSLLRRTRAAVAVSGWTLPGVTGAGGLQALIKYGLDVRGQRTVIAGSGPLLLASAATARQAGARVSHVLEQAAWADVAGFGAGLWRWPSKLAQAAKLVTAAYRPDAHVVEAFGDMRLERVRIRQGDREFDVDCDRLACGFGLVPNTVLPSHLGCRIDDGAVAVDVHQRTSRDGVLRRVSVRASAAANWRWSKAKSPVWRRPGRPRSWPRWLRNGRTGRCLPMPYASVSRSANRSAGSRGPTRCCAVARTCVSTPSRKRRAGRPRNCSHVAGWARVRGACSAAAQALFGWTPPMPRTPLVPARVGTLMLDGTASCDGA